MSHSQFHCTGRVYLDLHGLIFETSICYWQDQPGSPSVQGGFGADARPKDNRSLPCEGGRRTEALRPPPSPRGDVSTGSPRRGPSDSGFEKHHARRKARRASGRGSAGANPSPAAGSVVGRLGETGRLGLATKGSAGEDREALPAIEANPQAGGTVRPNTSARLAGGGPPMAGHVCRSVSG